MNYTIISQPEKIIVGIAIRTTNQNDLAAKDIPKLWERFYQEKILEAIPNKKSNEIYALYFDYEGDWTLPYTTLIGCEVNSIENLSPALMAKATPAINYAHFEVNGPFPDSLVQTWQSIWNDNLPRAYAVDYEHYGESFNIVSSPAMDLFIGLKK